MGWIIAENVLPIETGWYLITNNSYQVEIAFFHNLIWYYDEYDIPLSDCYVLAWMFLPEPYNSENHYATMDEISEPLE